MTGWLHPGDEGYPHEELTMTETQDGELCGDDAWDKRYVCVKPKGHEGAHDYRTIRDAMLVTYTDPCPVCGRRPNARMRKWLATPTPDDRDREVERIAAVLRSLSAYVSPPGHGHPARTLYRHVPFSADEAYDAGLRASGGRWTDEHGSPEGADRAIDKAMDIP